MDDLCEQCGQPGIVRINEFWWCTDHVDEGFRRVARLVSVLKGIPADQGEAAAVRLLDEARASGRLDGETQS